MLLHNTFSPSPQWYLLREHHRRLRKESKESFKVGCRLVEIIKSLASSGVTRLTKGEGGLGLGASDSGQGDATCVLHRSRVQNKYKYVDLYTPEEICC